MSEATARVAGNARIRSVTGRHVQSHPYRLPNIIRARDRDPYATEHGLDASKVAALERSYSGGIPSGTSTRDVEFGSIEFSEAGRLSPGLLSFLHNESLKGAPVDDDPRPSVPTRAPQRLDCVNHRLPRPW